jgi:hypothetical protein
VVEIGLVLRVFIVTSVKHFLLLCGQNVLGHVTTPEITADANDPIACPSNRSVKNKRLHARLADEPATLACERETKAVSDEIDLVEDVGHYFWREFRETGSPHT